MNFLWWLAVVVVIGIGVNGGVGHEDCGETRCHPDGPAIRWPFRLKDRQPIHCGFGGFDISCDEYKATLLDMASSTKFIVEEINYTSHAIRGIPYYGCLPRELFYSNGSSPFEFVGRAILFSCPPSTVRDEYCSSSYGGDCLARLSPCHGNNSGNNHTYAVLDQGYGCDFGSMPLVSCIKVRDYISHYPKDSNSMTLHWSIPSCEHSKGRNHRRPNLKILGISALCLVLIATGTTIYYVYNSNKKEKENQLRIERFLDEYRAMKPSRYSYADIKRITSQFKEKLGQGAYGTVFKGKLSSELLVAVKILNNSNENGEDCINEVGTRCKIHHVNVVRLVGICADGFIRALVYEYLPNCSLQNFLSSADNKNSFIGWDKLQDIALGIAKGIEYLHQGCDQRILHFDIKPHNVLQP
ncbi:LEAF RUST 10 DISEASE-RESISTANCE LOCUS RECEPTOR-LIKE PROTEIN KINASE-like 2.1 [Prunus avium]|uniref:LEAF RUST 10 DISEASE-RESISTANCE LOCUS RECEPTOR-LIKE PROTEIN KINASE-like 2.1 n=1 Tax=Prunus avium TaxID=42229 RepID=A0A6P5RM50_PRUAV|nr:LEAF RUST 10 DISEASE-RESISTANCE LOCUS RECEPTOR-LIKE PROTEIN KINASE-like 2.1 [Prunus avium]